MLHGSKEKFAIEAMSEPHLVAPSSVWGRMRVWCQGTSIGDFKDAHCALYPSYLGFKQLAKSLPSLWRQEFEGLSHIELSNLLDGALYGYHGDIELEDDRTTDQCRNDWDRYGIFNFLTNWGEQFDRDGKSFIVCTPAGVVRVLNRSLPVDFGTAVETSLVDAMYSINSYLAWFEAESRRLQGRADA
jgi:hypothetical protein